MGRDIHEGDTERLSEPEIVQCVFLSGATLRVADGVLRFVGWVDEDGERRVRIRYAIPVSIAQELNAEFSRMTSERRH